MRTQRFTTLAAMLLAITMASTTALAQSGNNEGRRRSREGSARTSDAGNQNRGNRGDVAVSRSGARGESSRGTANSQQGRQSDNRSYNSGSSGSRTYDNNRGTTARGNDRGNNGRQSTYGRADIRRYDNRYDNRGSYSNRGYGYNSYGRSSYRYGSYDRNAWRGRLRFGLGISIFAGRPYSFRFDYGWRPSFDYRYSMRVGMAYGGMAFLLNPQNAEVYIDGEFVGIAGDFGGQPVPLAAGYHRIELYAPGYEPAAFDINVLPGQVIPYRGDLYPVY